LYTKNLFRSQPEDGFMKKGETCRCYYCLIIRIIKSALDCKIIYILLAASLINKLKDIHDYENVIKLLGQLHQTY